MYTATLKTDDKNTETRSRTVTVTFTDGVTTFDLPFRFKLGIAVEQIKKAVKSTLDELNAVPEDITGDIDDYTAPAVTPTQDDIDRDTWLQNYRNLKVAKELEALGADVITPAQMTTLQDSVKNGFKNEYANLIN